MFRGLRRSNRIARSLGLDKRTKKPPVYVNLEEEQEMVGVHESSKNKNQAVDRNNNSNVNWRGILLGGHDRSGDWNMGKNTDNESYSEEEMDFVTPAECFSKSRRDEQKQNEICENSGKSLKIGIDGNQQWPSIINLSTSRKRLRDNEGRSSRKALVTRSRVTQKKVQHKVNNTVKRASSKVAKQNGSCRQGGNPNVKKPRTYGNYIQKKFSPSIMTDVLAGLSDEQKKWVSQTGFADILSFRMVWYTHNLGYNVVRAFNSDKCCLELISGKIDICDQTVRSVLGFPMGKELIVHGDEEEDITFWGKQFEGCAGCHVTPLMLSNEIMGSVVVDRKFKLNFLVLMYNFFIEGNQNRFLNRDVLKYSLDIDNCGRYNWCRLLLDKLKKAHVFWAAVERRYFSGSLIFLIYLYVSKVCNNCTIYIPPTYPAYKGWPDRLLRERQKFEAKNESFGVGKFVSLKYEEEGNNDCTNVAGTSRNLTDERHKISIANNGGNTEELDETGNNANDTGILNETNKMENNSIGDEMFVEDSLNVDDDVDSETIGECPARNFYDRYIAKDYGQGPVEDKTTTFSRSPITKTAGEGKASYRRDTNSNMKKFVDDTNTNIETPGDNMPNSTGPVDYEIKNTQTRADDVIENHFDENKYVDEFARNMEDLRVLYKTCLDSYEISFALYPQNPILKGIKKDYSYFFKMFHDTSPISKRLNIAKEIEETVENKDSKDIPSFSLGLSQMTPKNLVDDMEGVKQDGVNQEECDRNIVTTASKYLISRDINAEMVRPQRETRASMNCKSPFVSRVVDVGAHVVTAEERRVWEWLFSNRKNRRDLIFEWNGRMCSKAHFQSLDDNKMVETTVIDAWTCMLNENEILRSNSSPLRLFLNTETTYGPMNMIVKEGDVHSKLKRDAVFHDNMDVVLEMVNGVHKRIYDVKDFDMFVFPVYNQTHHYIVCYNMKKPAWDIIDNRVQTSDWIDMFGDIPFRLHEMFSDWISIYNLPKSGEIPKLQPRVVRLGWQTKDNWIDCGIFVMRHMETYMGNLYGWKVGIGTENGKMRELLKKLRMIYCHKILTWNGNKQRQVIMRNVAAYTKEKKKRGEAL